MIYPAATTTMLFLSRQVVPKAQIIFSLLQAELAYYIPLQHPLHDNPVAASASANSADVADLADRATVLGQVLRAVKRTGDGGLTAGVDGGVAGAANGEFGKSVELDVDCVCGLALGDGFEFAGLEEMG